MSNVAVITDSTSGITRQQAAILGVEVIPMPFFIDGELYYEGVNLSHEDFYACLQRGADVRTSQPALFDIAETWNRALRSYDEVVYIPLTSGLSAACHTAVQLASEYDGRVEVVDNKRISWTLKQAVIEAVTLAREGASAREIRRILERDALEASIYITVDTLKYLKKGGRITPAAASIGAVLNIKPVLQIQGERLDAFAKVRGMKAAKATMLDAVQNDVEHRFLGHRAYIRGAYTCSDAEAAVWQKEIQARFPGRQVLLDPLALNIACHVGPGAVAIGCIRQLDETGYLDCRSLLAPAGEKFAG